MLSVRIVDRDGNVEEQVFERSEITIGRVPGNDLVLARGSVSKKHARIFVQDGAVQVTDLKSTNGTSVEGQRVETVSLVRPGDRVTIGDFVLTIAHTSTPQPVHQPPTPRSGGVPTAAMRAGRDLDEDVDDLIESLKPQLQARSFAAQNSASAGPERRSAGGPTGPVPSAASEPIQSASRPGAVDPVPAPAPRRPGSQTAPGSPSPYARPSSEAALSAMVSPNDSGAPNIVPRNTFQARVRFDETFPRGTRAMRLRLDSTGKMTHGAGAPDYSLPQPTPPFVQARREAVALLLQRVQLDPNQSFPPDTGTRAQMVGAASGTLDQLDSAAPVQEADRRTLIRLIADDVVAIGPIESYLNDPEITAIHAPTWDRVYLTRRGRTAPAPYAFATRDAFIAALHRIAAGRTGNEGAISELRTSDGLLFRVSDPTAASPSLFALREIAPASTLEELVTRGTLPATLAALLPQVLRAGGGIAIIANSLFDASNCSRAIAGRAAATLPVIAGSTDGRLADLGIGVVDPTANFAADVGALSPSVVLFDDVDSSAVAEFLAWPGTRSSGWVLPLAATEPESVVPQLSATASTLDGLTDRLASALVVSRLHLIVQVQRTSDGRLVLTGVWDVDHAREGMPTLCRIYAATSSGSAMAWEESTPAPRLARLLSTWAESGVPFDPGVDFGWWRAAGPARRPALS